jgi:glycosyltransferase involved in cell wall biosynthesis
VATGTSNPSRAIVKGYDLIEQLAALHPDWTFSLVGDPNYFSSNPNVQVLGKMKATELLELYNSHQFYLQLSTSEGFPNALGEAMACGCIPIGSAVGAIPEIIGDSGIILAKKNLKELDKLLISYLNSSVPIFHLARTRISNKFSFQHRQKLLYKNLTLIKNTY